MQTTFLLIAVLAVGVTYSGCVGCMATYQISMRRSGPQRKDPVIVRFSGKVTKDGTGLLYVGVRKDSKDYFGDATGVIIEKPASQPDGLDLKDMVFTGTVSKMQVYRSMPIPRQKKVLEYKKDSTECKLEKRKVVCGECPDKPLIQTTTRVKPIKGL